MNLPTRATSLDGEIASHQVMIKTPRQRHKAPCSAFQEAGTAPQQSHKPPSPYGEPQKRPDGQIQRRAEENAVRRMNTPRQFTEIHTGIANGKNTQKRKTYACDQKADCRGNRIYPRILPHEDRKYQISRPENNANSMSPIAMNALFVFSPIEIFLSAILQNTRELQPLPQVDMHFVCYVRNIISHFPLIINHFFNISPSAFRRPLFRKRHAFP